MTLVYYHLLLFSPFHISRFSLSYYEFPLSFYTISIFKPSDVLFYTLFSSFSVSTFVLTISIVLWHDHLRILLDYLISYRIVFFCFLIFIFHLNISFTCLLYSFTCFAKCVFYWNLFMLLIYCLNISIYIQYRNNMVYFTIPSGNI